MPKRHCITHFTLFWWEAPFLGPDSKGKASSLLFWSGFEGDGGGKACVLFLSPFFLPHKKSLAEHGVSLEGITTGTAQRDDKQIQYSSAPFLVVGFKEDGGERLVPNCSLPPRSPHK